MKISGLKDNKFANVFAFSSFWAAAMILSKLGINMGAHPISYLIEASFVSLLVLTVYVGLYKRPDLKATTPRTVGILVLLNIIGAVATILTNIGYTMTSAVNIGFLGKFTLVTTLVMARLVLGEKMNLSKIVAAFVMLLGVFFMTTQGRGFIPQKGDIFLLTACVGLSANSVFIKKMFANITLSGVIVSFYRILVRLVFIFGFSLFVGVLLSKYSDVFSFEFLPLNMLWLVVLRGIVSAGSIVFLYRSLKVATASYTTMMSMMTPVMVSVVAILFMGEYISFWQMLGGGLILLSGVVTHYLKV